ncbi:permease, partial [Plantactinospora sp. S1510]|nr:permease [Plantactinospora alkalitolerans]
MSTYQCSSCGREIEAAPRCPYCRAEQPERPDDLARIERSIAEMKIREAAIAKEQKTIASQMQAALFQRDILSHAADQRRKQNTKPRRVLRRKANRRSPAAAGPMTPTPPTVTPSSPPPRVPRQPKGGRADRMTPPPPPPPPAPGEEPTWDEGPAGRPEASTREVQNILLGLGALLLGIAAVVFAAVALSSLDDFSRVAILLLATALMLAVPPRIAKRGLIATAETVAAVGLLLVPLVGYALWTVNRFGDSGLPGSLFAGLVFLLTAVVAAAYAGATGLNAPRYAAVLAVQPILPLLAYSWLRGPTGWAVVLTAVAVGNLYLSRLFTDDGRLTGWPARFRFGPAAREFGPAGAEEFRTAGPAARVPGGTDRAPRTTGPAGPDGPEPLEQDGLGPDRPETFPEEADAVLQVDLEQGGPGNRVRTVRARPAPTPWVRELTWTLHALAFTAAVVCAVAALMNADTVPGAARAGTALLLAAAVGLAGALALRQPPFPDIGAAILTLAVIGAAGRVAAVALPGRALVVIAAVIALTGLGVRAVPEAARRGPQLASAAALVVIGVVVAGNALRAAMAPIRAALPVWEADLADYPGTLAAGVGATSWQLAVTALLLTIAAVLASPPEVRREFAVVGAALTALAMPASLGLPWAAAPWPAVVAAIGIGLVGLSADTRRGALTHAVAAAGVGLAGAAASVVRPGLTAA